MTVVIEDVRRYLNDISDDQVSDNAIEKQIGIAESIIENERGSELTEQLRDNAVLAQAGLLTYIAFTTEMERSLGVLPPVVATHIDHLKEIADLFLSYIRKGVSGDPTKLVSVTAFDLAGSLWAYRESDPV